MARQAAFPAGGFARPAARRRARGLTPHRHVLRAIERESVAGEIDPCPSIAVSGNQVTLTGGCTTADQVRLEGSATVTNPTAWDQVDFQFGDDVVYDLDGWSLTQSTFTQSYTGRVRISDFTVWDADVATVHFGIELRSDIYYECDRTSCDLDGSGIELPGIGGAHGPDQQLRLGELHAARPGHADRVGRARLRVLADLPHRPAGGLPAVSYFERGFRMMIT